MHHNKLTPTHLLLFILLGVCGALMASAQDQEDPPAANEIICFAAQQKWVCAPADQKQQAHDKAMRLAREQSTEKIDSNESRDPAEVQAMPASPDFESVVQEQPANSNQPMTLADAVKDFMPREDVATDTDVAAVDTAEEVVPEAINEPAIETTPATDSPAVSDQSPMTQSATTQPAQADANTTSEVPVFQTAPNDFDHWQLSYADQWTFQVVGTSNRHQLDAFVIQHGLQDRNYTIAKTQANGADWWIVLTGLYDSREAALSQRDQLPAALADGAWVRQVKTIVGQADR